MENLSNIYGSQNTTKTDVNVNPKPKDINEKAIEGVVDSQIEKVFISKPSEAPIDSSRFSLESNQDIKDEVKSIYDSFVLNVTDLDTDLDSEEVDHEEIVRLMNKQEKKSIDLNLPDLEEIQTEEDIEKGKLIAKRFEDKLKETETEVRWVEEDLETEYSLLDSNIDPSNHIPSDLTENSDVLVTDDELDNSGNKLNLPVLSVETDDTDTEGTDIEIGPDDELDKSI